MHEFIKIVANYFIILAALGAGITYFVIPRTKRLHYIALLILGGILSYCFALIASKLYNDPRPFVQGHFVPLIAHAADNGFPSDHTLLASFFGFAALHYSRKLGAATLFVALLIGLSRMAAGVHHSWDILGSFFCAALGAWVAAQLIARYMPTHFKKA